MNIEISIYLQNFKNHLEKNDKTKQYFIPNDHLENEFFTLLEKYSINQFENTGQPQLTVEQLEEIRLKILEKKRPIQFIGKWGIIHNN